ncbi:hypothetical protein L1987_16097 [Smallanthus sonchifolius]|uniref:Uncharacterized protein n=1 Tax=Smallanthus sonchifolius TaxID=185202 RepID=A0ACB9J8Y3_9ASTR|nr:hypothetical protein L1987_16097 [Smallanthus sonchifolius]
MSIRNTSSLLLQNDSFYPIICYFLLLPTDGGSIAADSVTACSVTASSTQPPGCKVAGIDLLGLESGFHSSPLTTLFGSALLRPVEGAANSSRSAAAGLADGKQRRWLLVASGGGRTEEHQWRLLFVASVCEKVASMAYVRIQGKVALVTHFQNSSLMNEDKWCRPILFQTEAKGNDNQQVSHEKMHD